jgi:hypothetical protein
MAFMNKKTEKAFEKLIQKSYLRMFPKLASVLIVCALYGFYWRYMKSKYKKALQFFTMIPKSIMCSLKMTIQLRKTNFFDKIEMV